LFTSRGRSRASLSRPSSRFLAPSLVDGGFAINHLPMVPTATESRVRQSLNKRTHTSAIRASFTRPLNNSLVRFIDTLSDQVLQNLGRGFLCAFSAASNSSAANVVKDAFFNWGTEVFKELEHRENFRSAYGCSQRCG